MGNKEILRITFKELVDRKKELRVATDDYTIIAMDKFRNIYIVHDMGAEDIGNAMWDFLEIEARYLDEEILGRASELGY